MPRVRDVLDALDLIAPTRFAFSFDKVGLQIGDPNAKVASAMVSLDWSDGLVDAAIAAKATLLICHHPLIWNPLASITTADRAGQITLRLIQNGIAFIGCHTNWDCAKGGVNDALAEKLGLIDVKDFGSAADVEQYRLVVYSPTESTQTLIDAMSAAGAGMIGGYERCAFWSPGTGTYVGGEGTRPAFGDPGKIESVSEDRLEMVVSGHQKSGVLQALLQAHPYEEPAFDLVPLAPKAEQQAGRIGKLPSPMKLAAFTDHVNAALGTMSLAWGDPNRKIAKVALTGGAADGEWRKAKAAGADAFITGEVAQNVALDAAESGLAILASGHYATEQPGMAALKVRLDTAVPAVKWSLYEPAPGSGGRPL